MASVSRENPAGVMLLGWSMAKRKNFFKRGLPVKDGASAR